MNETNTIQNITRVVQDAGDTIGRFGPFVLTVLGVILIGYAVKFAPIISNRLIPLISFISGVLIYVLLSDPGDAPFTMRYPIVRHMIIGLAAAAVAWVIHIKFLRDLIDERYLFTNSKGDTRFLKRDEVDSKDAPKNS